MKRTTGVMAALIVGALVVLGAGLLAQSKADIALRAAIETETVKGDLKAAIEQYKALTDGPDRAVAAKALVRLGECYQKQGSVESTKAWERVVREFSDQKEAAEQARALLAVIGQQGAVVPAQKLWDYGRYDDVVSPDGTYIVHGGSDLVLREVPSGRERNLTKSVDGSEHSAFSARPSPDSRWVLYDWNEKGKPHELRIISRDGGVPRVIFRFEAGLGADASSLGPLGWSPDARTVIVLTRVRRKGASDWDPAEYLSVPVSGGSPSRLVPKETVPLSGSVSPDGRCLAYAKSQDIYLLSLADGTSHVVAPHPANDQVLGWLPGSRTLLFLSDRRGTYGVWAVKTVDGQADGEPWLVRADTGPMQSLGITGSGDLYYTCSWVREEIQIATLDSATGRLAGSAVPLQGRYSGGMTQAAWSPDGTRIAYIQTPPARRGEKKLAIKTMATGEVQLLNLPMSAMNNPEWLPEGRALVIQGQDNGKRQGIFRVDIDGNGFAPVAAKVLPERGGAVPKVSSDGRMYYRSSGGLDVCDIASGSARTLWSSKDEFIVNLAASSDGRWVAWTSMSDSGSNNLYVMPGAGGEPRVLPVSSVTGAVGVPGGLAFAADGNSVFVAVSAESGPKATAILRLPVDGSAAQDTGIRLKDAGVQQISAHRDGRRLALSTVAQGNETWGLPKVAQAVTAPAVKR